MELSIIIVNWNSVAFLKECIESIKRHTSGVDYEIVVVDSASYDGCAAMLAATFPDVRFMQAEQNVGFGRANNIGVRLSRGRCLLFLNPDTKIIDSAISTMYECLQRIPTCGVVGCKLLNPNGTLQTSCIQAFPTIMNQVLDADCLRTRWPRSSLWGASALYEGVEGPRVVQALAGACIMLKREVFERIGMFGQEYFMYAEDIDLCYKVKELGFRSYYVPNVSVVHYGGGSAKESPSDFSVVMMRESIWMFLRKTRGEGYAELYRIAMLVSALVRLTLLRMSSGPLKVRPAAPVNPSWKKWRAILRWSIRREVSVKKFSLPTAGP